MPKLLAVYILGIAVFCALAFGGLSTLGFSNDSSQVSECVLSALREQEKAREADEERFVNAMRGVPRIQVLEMMRMLPPPPTAAEAEYARNQQLIRIKELCRLRVSASSQ
jgi:hypothetical protein